MTPDQRLIGMDLIELRALAFGGDPAGAELAGRRLSRAAAALEQVSVSLERAAGQVGLGWRGEAADAARTGIAGHAQWARTAAARAAAAGTSASAQAASANYVRANMPDPGVGSAALGLGGSPVTADPVGTDLARAEEAQRNARLRAVELLEGHAAKSEAQRPTGTLEAPPGGAGPAGGAAGRGGPAAAGRGAAAAGRGGAAGPARTSTRVPGPGADVRPGTAASRPFTGGRRVPFTAGPRGGAAGGATEVAAARGGPAPTGGAATGTGPRPAGYGTRLPVEALGSDPGVSTTAAAGTGTDLGLRRRPEGDGRTGPRAGRIGLPAREAAPGAGRGPDGVPVLPARHGGGVELRTEQQQAGQGGPGDRAGHRMRESTEPSGVSPPIGGPLGGTGGTGGAAPGHARHRRLGFLIDEDCVFDDDRGSGDDRAFGGGRGSGDDRAFGGGRGSGDDRASGGGRGSGEDPAGGGWVTPPVIGA